MFIAVLAVVAMACSKDADASARLMQVAISHAHGNNAYLITSEYGDSVEVLPQTSGTIYARSRSDVAVYVTSADKSGSDKEVMLSPDWQLMFARRLIGSSNRNVVIHLRHGDAVRSCSVEVGPPDAESIGAIVECHK